MSNDFNFPTEETVLLTGMRIRLRKKTAQKLEEKSKKDFRKRAAMVAYIVEKFFEDELNG